MKGLFDIVRGDRGCIGRVPKGRKLVRRRMKTSDRRNMCR